MLLWLNWLKYGNESKRHKYFRDYSVIFLASLENNADHLPRFKWFLISGAQVQKLR
jgi:hypothetical protein